MVTRVPDFFEAFRCWAGDCPDSCCGQWEIVIEPEVKERYLALEGPVGDVLRASLETVDGEDRLKLRDGRCPMLREDGLCELICVHGTGLLSETCDSHPRFTEVYGGLRETMLSVSCPAAAELLLERETPLTFVTSSDAVLPEPTDLDPALFLALMECRETAIAIVQDRSRRFSDRLALLVSFGARLDGCVDRPALMKRFGALYREPGYCRRELIRVKRLRKYGTMTHGRQLLLAMEHLTAEFPAVLKELETTELESRSVMLEHLTVYFLFRWWMKAACDGYLWRQAAAVVVSVLAIAGMGKTMGSLKEAARLFSKEVEHNEDNLQLLRRAMELPQFSRRQLLRILEVSHAI